LLGKRRRGKVSRVFGHGLFLNTSFESFELGNFFFCDSFVSYMHTRMSY